MPVDLDPIPTAVHDLLSLFETGLPEGGFPDVGPESLGVLMNAVHRHHASVVDAREQLEHAKAELETHRAELLAHARRGVAYGLVFADGDEALTEHLQELGLHAAEKPTRRAPKRRRQATTASRPGSDDTHMELPLADPQAAEAELVEAAQ